MKARVIERALGRVGDDAFGPYLCDHRIAYLAELFCRPRVPHHSARLFGQSPQRDFGGLKLAVIPAQLIYTLSRLRVEPLVAGEGVERPRLDLPQEHLDL